MAKKYRVTLTVEERIELQRMVGSGKAAARKLNHARILLKADEGGGGGGGGGGPGLSDEEVADEVGAGLATVARVRQRFVEEGLDAALTPRPTTRVYARKLDGDAEARLVKLACSAPPEGRNRWTLRLLADRMVVLGHADAGLSYEAVRRALKKTSSSRG
jgi:transposase